MTGLAHNEIELLENIFRQTDCVKKAVLFGSRAMGLHRHNSDVDIALYGDGITMRDILRINAKIEETTMPYMFDFVLGGNANQALSEHIRTYGKVIYRGGMRYKLGDVASFIDYRGKTPPKTPHGIPLVTAKIVKENVIQQPTEYIAVDYYDEWMRRGIPQKGAVVFTTEAPLGEVAQIKADDKLAFAQRIIVLQGEKDRLDNDFLFYSLQYELMRERIRARSTGTTVVRIKAAELRQVEIDLPDLDTQRAIAATLRALDDKIAANTKLNHHLEQIAQAIFKSWFEKFMPSKPFTDVVQVLGGGTPKTGTTEYWNGDIPFFTPKDALSTYTLVTEKTLTEEGLSNCNSRRFPINTVFVTARGTVGKLVLAGIPMAMNQSCYALVGINGYGQYYVYHLAQYVVESLKHKASGAVFDAIVTRDFESEFIPNPTIDEAGLFEEKVAPIYKTILNNSNETLNLTELRDTLLPRLMSGELSVADLGDVK